jgi:hypothetical protein
MPSYGEAEDNAAAVWDPSQKRGIHAIAGLKLLVGRAVAFILGIIALWSYLST